MIKVLVDPAALEEAAKWLEVHSSSSGSAEAFAAEALREAIAQPAEAEGVQLRRYTPISQGDHMPAMNSCDQGGWVRHSDHLAALSAVTAERDRLQSQLAETQANDRTAMGYLHDVRQLVGGSDFPEMVRNVARMVDALPGCVELIEALSPIEGDVLRKARAAMAAKEA